MKRILMIFVIAMLTLAPALNSSPAIAATGAASDIISDSLFSDDFRTWENQLKNKRTSIRPSSVAAAGTQRTPAWYRQQALSTARGGAASAIPAASTAAQGTTSGGLAKVGGKISGAAGALGQAAMGVAGVTMIYDSVGGVTANLFGVESNGLWCDLGTLFGSSCRLGPSVDYTPNLDIPVYSPGWANGGVHALTSTRGNPVTVTFSVEHVGDTLFMTVTRGSYMGSWEAWNESVFLNPQLSAFLPNGKTSNIAYGFWTGLRRGDTEVGGDRLGTHTITHSVDLPSTHTSFQRLDVQIAAAQVIDTWYPVGHPDRPADIDLNPARHWSSTWQCEGPPGTVTQSAVSPEFFETDEEWPAFPQPSCESTQTLTWWKIDQVTPGLDPFTVYEWEIDQETQTLLGALSPEEKAGTHFLELYRVDEGYEVSCFENPSLCADWFEDPEKADNYVCKYGDETVSLAECSLYAPTFRYTDYRQGIDYADPDTGVSTAPIVTPSEPAQSPDCPPPFSWTSLFNPWYYYKAATCALEWAFVPTIDFGLKFETAGWHIAGSFIGSIQRFFEGIVGAFDVGHLNRCGLLVDTSPSVFRGASLTVDTCSGFWAQAGPLRTIAGAGFVIGSAFMAMKILLRVLNVHVEQGAASDN